MTGQMRKLETKIRQKEQLAEGLHLIDFEQLKIENQSLNEKIEERNEELLKLRKKTTATVQVLTHIKEKLQFVEKENQVGCRPLKQPRLSFRGDVKTACGVRNSLLSLSRCSRTSSRRLKRSSSRKETSCSASRQSATGCGWRHLA